MSAHPPSPHLAPPRPRGSGRRRSGPRAATAVLVVGLLALGTGCGRPGPSKPASAPTAPESGGPEPSVSAGAPALDGLLVATVGQLSVSDTDGGLIAFDPAPDRADAVTASAGVIVAVDAAGEAMVLDTAARAPAWSAVRLPADLPGTVRLVALGPFGRQLAIVAGDPQGPSFELAVLDLRTGASANVPVTRGLNGPPSWIGAGTVAVDVIRDAGHSGIATIDIRTGGVEDQPGSATIAASSLDGTVVALDDPATGDVLIGDLAAWQARAVATMRRIHGPSATGIEALAMSADATRLAIVRRSDAGGSVAFVVGLGNEWRTVRTLTTSGDAPITVAWLR